jgi:hypothetical protein
LFLLFGNSIGHLWIFILLFTTVEATYPVAWAMVGAIFGRKHFAKIRNYMSMFYVWGRAFSIQSRPERFETAGKLTNPCFGF